MEKRRACGFLNFPCHQDSLSLVVELPSVQQGKRKENLHFLKTSDSRLFVSWGYMKEVYKIGTSGIGKNTHALE